GTPSAISCAGESSKSISSDFRDLLYEFTVARVRFVVVGAYAVIQHTEPRYTKDLDLWIEPTAENARRVYRALGRFGAPLARLSTAELAQPQMVFQIGVAPVRVDLLTSVAGLRSRPPMKQP